MLRIKFLLLALIIVSSSLLHAEKVAVVLSGGGAKGYSHIGVLKALEEYYIPIDYIAGTSMGAIVGGLYASGYSPLEIEKLMTSKEFMEWASGEVSNKYLHYYKKADPNSSWVSIPFKINEKFDPRLSLTLIPTHVMDFTFMEIFAGPSAAANYDFDNLFVPFRCVASDIEANEEVVMESGQLGDALRASMAVPFYFSPVRVDGRLLFDGGMYNNFPVDVAYRVFEPDVIIGSKAASNFNPPEDDDVISQLQNMLMEKTDYNFIPGKGVLIKPDLGDMNVIDFSRAQEFIDSGYLHTVNQIQLIESLLDRRVHPDSLFQKRLSFYYKKPSIVIDSISVTGLNPAQSEYVNKQIAYKDHRLVTLNDFKNDYYGLVADDKIQSVYPRLVYNSKTDHFDLSLNVKKVNSYLAEFGGNLSTNAFNQGYIGVHYKSFAKKAIDYGLESNFGRFYSGGNAKIRIDYPGKLPFYLQLEYTYHVKDYFKNTSYFVDELDPSFLVQYENYYRFSFGTPITNQSKLIAGLTSGRLKDEYYQTNDFTSTDITDVTHLDFLSPYLSYDFNTLNKKKFPTEGIRFLASFRYVWGREKHYPGFMGVVEGPDIDFIDNHSYYQISGVIENYFAVSRGLKLGFYGEIYLSSRSFYNNYTASILSSPQFQPTLESQLLFLPSYRANNYVAFGMRNVINIYKSIDLRLAGFVFQPQKSILQNEETQRAYYGESFSNRAWLASASLVVKTPIGPLSATLNYYSHYKNSFTFNINAGFIIFSKWALD